MGNKQSTARQAESQTVDLRDEKSAEVRPLLNHSSNARQTWSEWAFGERKSQKPPPAFHGSTATADDQLRSIYIAEWKWRQEQYLEPDDSGSNEITPNLPKVDPATQKTRLSHWEHVLESLDRLQVADLSSAERLNYGVYRAQIEAFANQIRFKDYEKPLSGDTAFWSNEAQVPRSKFTKLQHYEHYLTRLSQMPRYFGDSIDNMRRGLARGFTPPKVTLNGRGSSLTFVVDAKAEENPYYLPFRVMPTSIPAKTQAELRKRGLDAISSQVIPSHRSVLSFFRDEYYPNAREALSAESLPNGKAYYQSKIKEFTTTTLSPKKIHELGLSEVSKIRRQMLDIMEELAFKGSLADFLAFLRADPQFYAKSPEGLLKDAAWIAKEFDGVASSYFGRLPRARFAIVPVPPEIAPFWTSGRGGYEQYYVNTYDLKSRALYSLPALTLHESAPGHCFQMSLEREHKLPDFRHAYISAYGEGWGLYCEHLGVEMGMYRTPYETFGMLSYQAWRAARLVVDTGVHALGWSREEAQMYLKENTALSEHEVETEVDRYISWPGQALSYYLGMLQIKDVRRKAEAGLGQRFDIRAFHDALLQTGSVPLPLMVEHMDKWVEGGGKSPYE